MAKKRPSPDQHASETDPGEILKGNDKSPWVCKEFSGGVKRWVKLPDVKGKFYITHNNGGSPYKAVVQGNSISVYVEDDDLSQIAWDKFREKKLKRKELNKALKNVYIKKVWEAKNPKKIFVGSYQGPFYKSYPEYDGNSILVQLDKQKFVFIGDSIFSFKAKDLIQEYYSPVGNSDVPYPWAVGDKFVYLMIADACIPRERLAGKGDPYAQFYALTSSEKNKMRKGFALPQKKGIHGV